MTTADAKEVPTHKGAFARMVLGRHVQLGVDCRLRDLNQNSDMRTGAVCLSACLRVQYTKAVGLPLRHKSGRTTAATTTFYPSISINEHIYKVKVYRSTSISTRTCMEGAGASGSASASAGAGASAYAKA